MRTGDIQKLHFPNLRKTRHFQLALRHHQHHHVQSRATGVHFRKLLHQLQPVKEVGQEKVRLTTQNIFVFPMQKRTFAMQ